jgi:hypothetical protein
LIEKKLRYLIENPNKAKEMGKKRKINYRIRMGII